MKTLIIIVVLVLAVAAVIYFSSTSSPQIEFEPIVFASDQYDEAASRLQNQINELSPTPPTEPSWTIRDVEFVKSESYAYIIYHDTHNIFRILVETGQNNQYRTVASFEAAEGGWRLTHGEDLSAGRETVKITPSIQ